MKWFRTFLAIVSIVLTLGGGIAFQKGVHTYGVIKTRLVAQHIVTSPDASIPNAPVTNIETALAEADVIGKHASDAVKDELGQDLTYSEIPFQDEKGNPLPPDDPRVAARALLEKAAGLRTSLYAAATAFGLSQLVMAFGALTFVLGVVGLVFLALTIKKN